MGQVIAGTLVVSVLFGVGVGRKVERARHSHRDYQRLKGRMPAMRKAAWVDTLRAALTVLVVGTIVLIVVAIGVSVQD